MNAIESDSNVLEFAILLNQLESDDQSIAEYAFSEILKHAQGDHPDAQIIVAGCYLNGVGVMQSPEGNAPIFSGFYK